jgi:hypothetical protein
MPPLSGPRAIQVSRTLAALARRGWESTVIAVEPRPGGPLLRDTAGAAPFNAPGVEVVRVPSPEETLPYRVAMRAIPALAYRPDRHRGWMPAAVQEAERRLRAGAYRCVVTFAQPWTDHLIGLRLRRDVGLPWIAHFSDPWVDSPYLPEQARALARRFEAEVIQDADALVFVTQQTVDTVMAKYPPALGAKAHVVPHGYDRRIAPEPDGDLPRKRMKLVYTGRFYDDVRTPDALFSAIARFVDEPDLQLVLMGPNMTRYQSTVQRYGIGELVVLSSAAPYQTALREAASADALVVVDADADGASMFLPSKLIDYLMLRKPVLGITPADGASADLLHRLGFQTAAPNDADAIEARIRELVAAWKSGTLDVPPQFDAVAAGYDIVRTSAAFAAILDRWR